MHNFITCAIFPPISSLKWLATSYILRVSINQDLFIDFRRKLTRLFLSHFCKKWTCSTANLQYNFNDFHQSLLPIWHIPPPPPIKNALLRDSAVTKNINGYFSFYGVQFRFPTREMWNLSIRQLRTSENFTYHRKN